MANKGVKGINKTHGESGRYGPRSPEYVAWLSMRQRCNDPAHSNFPRYGGRGVSVCDAWNDSYEQFLSDMGRKPSPNHSIDRIDVNGNYEPSNCRWATFKNQQNNRTNIRFGMLNGELMPLSQIAERTGVPDRTIRNWMNTLGDGADLGAKFAQHRPKA